MQNSYLQSLSYDIYWVIRKLPPWSHPVKAPVWSPV